MIVYDDYMIVDFNENKDLEASVLYSFLSEDDQLLFGEYISGLSPELIEERTVLTSAEWIFDWLPDPQKQIRWYAPKSKEELKQCFLKTLYPPYHCVVLSRNKGIKEYKYILFAYEHAQYRDEECTALLVMREKEVGSFVRDIAPLIESLS